MKWGLYWRYATRSLSRGGLRTLLAIFCVAVGVLAVVSLQIVTSAVTTAFEDNVRQLNGGDVGVTFDTPLSGAQLAYFDQLQAAGTITSYTAADAVAAQVRSPTAALQLKVWAVDPQQFPLAGGVRFADPTGASLQTLLHGNIIVVTAPLAQTFNLGVGDTFHFTTRDGRAADVTVGGIIANAGFFQGPEIVMDYTTYAALPSSESQTAGYDEVYVSVPSHTDKNAANAEQMISQQFPLAATQTTKELLASEQAQVQTMTYFLQIVGLLALLIGGVGIVNTVQVALQRRRIEIAMLKTAGYRRRDLYTMFGLETGLIGLLGGVIGALAGAGLSFLVDGVLATALRMDLQVTLDARTILAGVAIGFVTALGFGLLPIVQASAVRPLAVLRELPERRGITSRLTSIALALLVGALFYALTAGILGNTLVAAGALGGTALALGLLGGILMLVVLAISRIPVPEAFSIPYILSVAVGVAAGLALLFAQPALGTLVLAIAGCGALVALLPRAAREHVRFALRNIGRRRARSVATLVALTVGVFAIGLVLVLGQDIQATLGTYLNGSEINVAVLAGGTDRPAIEQQLAGVPGLKNEAIDTVDQTQPVAINGQPVTAIIQAATATGKYNANDILRYLDGVQGHNLTSGPASDTSLFRITQGTQDVHAGRNLKTADTGTANALLPVEVTHAPLNMKLGDTFTLEDPQTHVQTTITVVGFYARSLDFEPIQVDSSVVTTLAHDNPSYLYLAYVDPAMADTTIAHIQAALPSVQTYSVADLLAQVSTIINNVIAVLVTIASLAMLASSIIIANAVALAMLERRRELGILKAVGYTSNSVLGGVLVENGVIGFTAGVVALALAAVAARILGSVLFGSTFSTPIATVFEVVPAAVVACMLVAALVALGTTRVRPLEVLRYE